MLAHKEQEKKRPVETLASFASSDDKPVPVKPQPSILARLRGLKKRSQSAKEDGAQGKDVESTRVEIDDMLSQPQSNMHQRPARTETFVQGPLR